MPTITINIPANRISDVIEGYLEVYPVPGDWKKTSIAWLKKCIARSISETTKDGLRSKSYRTKEVYDDYADTV